MSRRVPAVARALQVLDLLVTHPSDRFTLSQIVEQTGISLGSAHAVLATLEERGYIRRHPRDRSYGLGPAMAAAAVAAVEHQPAVQVATREISGLADRLGAQALVSAATRSEMIFVARAGHPTPWGPEVRDGERVPLMPPLGAVFMAWADRDEIEEWLERAPRGAAERNRNIAMLEVVRARGYAIGAASASQRVFGDTVVTLTDSPARRELRSQLDQLIESLAMEDYEVSSIDPSQEYSVGMIASPVFDREGRVAVAIVAHGLAPKLTAAEVVAAAEEVRASAIVATKLASGRFPVDTSG